ncbi:MFS transporter [Marinoscillum furvescens]|uniref:GPH family glycoside/pentoside/hexuronide:cation symporter n=1 Tax=Marinoscillum furvescens DSM 4134 TaxID=1122208 RepID=A0A3D9KZE6_MARFU|nr:MFS transporter [Marinoscillum furvescens]RED95286.1 GPH family glycoside/pentoside/hexuronide:cation symporter [Marinoscillum furvescens DSM 4134]
MSTPIALREKMAYGLGDFASSMFWKLFSMFLLFFYTDVFGISAAAVGTMFLVTRVWDALNDPLMGIISDRTRTRWGKFRPFLLFGAVPFGIIGVLTFTTPDLTADGKLVYAYITYTLMMMAYTFVNVPYGSLMAVMTDDGVERTSLASWRFIGAFSGGLFVTASANYLVEYFSAGGTQAQGFQYTITLYAVVAAVLFLLTFLGTRERLAPPKQEHNSLKDDLKDLSKNLPWFIMLGANISILIFNSLRDGSILYYFKYYVQDQQLELLGSTYELTSTVLSSVYMSVWLGTNIIGVLLAKPLAARWGKKTTFSRAALVSAALSFLFFALQPDQIILIFTLNIFIGISAGVILPLGWSMYADIADYSEWKTGRRATGLVFSSSSMSQKFGWTIGGAISGWLLAGFGFEPNAVQSEEALLGIRLMISVIAGVGALLSFVFMRVYKLDEAFMKKVGEELKAAG